MAENDPFSTQPTSVDTLDQLQTQQAVNKFEDLSRSPLPQEINQATDTRVFGEDLSQTKAYQQERGLVSSMLKDPTNLGGMANDTVKKSNSYADPQAFRDMAVNMRALSFLTGAPIDEVSEGYDRFKKGFAAQMGWQPTKSDSDFRAKLQAHFEQEDARKQAVTNLQTKAVQDAVSFADQGMGRNPLSAFSEWQQNEYAGLKGIPEAQQLQIFNQVYLPIQQQMNTPEGALAKEIVDTFHKGNEITRPVAESATGLIDKLSGYSDEQRKNVYALANTYAQTLDPTASINNPLWNMGQSLLRSTGNMSASISTAAQRVYTAAQVKDAEHGGAQGEINELNGLPSTPDTQGIEVGQQNIKNLSIAAELRQASQSMNDLPLGYGLPGIINKSISSALNATPYIAAFAADPIVGVGLMYGSTVADQQQRILANNPEMSIGKATLMAEAYAAPMSALMSISLPGVSGIFPAVERTLAQFAAEGTAANYAAHVAIGTAGMDLSSLSQIAGDAISQAIDKDFNPGASVKEQLIELWKSQPELLGSMMFLSAIGAGKTYHDTDQVAALAKVVGDTKTLKKYGFSDEQISKIQSAPLNEVQGVIAEEAGKRTPDNIASGISQARKDGQATKDAAESHETPTLTATDDGTHVIMAPDGNGGMQEVYRTKDQDAAMQALAMAYKAHDEGQLKTLHETIRYFEQADKEQGVEGRTYETKLTPDKEKVTFQDMLEQGIPLEQLKERMRIAGIHEDTALSDVVVDGMTKGDQYQDVIRVLNSNPRTAIHERLDATTTRALDSGKVSDEQMTKWIKQTEEATGHKYLSSETPTRQEIIEAVTSIGEEYAAGHFANREAAPSALKGYFKAMVRYFNNILSRAKVLHNGIKEGKIDANFEQHLAEGIGLPITERLAPAEAKAKVEMMGEKVGEPKPLEQGTLFSIRSKKDAERILGPAHPELAGKPKEAIERLIQDKTGYVPGALNHPQIGPVDLVWGETFDSKSKSYGLSKIVKWHPEAISAIEKQFQDSIITDRNENTIQLELNGIKYAVRKGFFGNKAHWLLTAYGEEGESARETIDTSGPKGGKVTQLSSQGSQDNLGQSGQDVNTSFSIRARDEAYDAAVKSGDEAEQQRLVDEAAKEAGYPLRAYHGTPNGDFQKFEDNGKGFFFTNKEFVAKGYTYKRGLWLSESPTGKVINTHLKMENPLEIDAMGSRYNNIRFPGIEWKQTVFGNLPKDAVSVSDAALKAFEMGHDGLIVKNVMDAVDHSDKTRSTVYVVKDASQIKSADPITRNDAGNVIPLLQRFNPESNDIRFSISTRADQERVQQELEKRIASSPTARTRIFENAAKRFEAITARQDKVMEAFAEGKASSSEVIRKDMESNLVELNAIMSALPAEVRASLTRNWRNPGTGEGGNIYTKYASLGSDKAKADFLIKTIQKASDLIDHQLRAEYVDRAYRLYDAAQPKNERGTGPKGKLGAEGHAIVNEVGSLWHMTAAEVSNYIKTRQAEMDTIDSGDSPLSSEDSITRRQELFNEILLAQIHGNFSPWDSRGKLKGQDNPDMNAEQSALALESLQGIIREGRYDWNQQLVARRDWVKSEQQKAIEAINGKEATTPEINQSKEKDAGILAGIDAYLDTHFTRAQLLDHILGQEQAAYWKRRIYDSANAEHDRNHATDIRDTRSLLQAIFGADTKDSVVNRTKLQMALSKLSGRKDTGIEVEENRKFQKNKIERITAEGYVQNPSTWKGSSADLDYMARTLAGLKSTSRVKYLEVREQVPDSGEKVKLHLSEMEAIQRLLSWRQADARPSLEYSGMTQEVADKLEAFVNKTAAGRAYYDYLKKAYDNYDEINAKFKEVFGVDMPRVKNYATLVWDTSKSQDKAKDLDGEHGGGASMTPSFGISRQNHAAKIRDENAWVVYQAHMRQVNYWLTHVDLNRDMRAILGNADVLRAAQAKKASYRDTLKEISGFIGKEKASAGELLGMNGEIAREAANYLGTSVLGYNAKVTLKHLIPSMSSSMMLAPDEFVGSLTRVLTGQAIKPIWGKDGMINSREVLRFLEASHSNNDREAVKAGSKPAPIRNAILAGQAIGEVGHSWIPAFVHQANAISSAIAYDASYHSAIKEGLTEAQAHEVARAKTDEILHQTNPVGFGIDRPAGEAGNALMRFLANFAGPVRQRFGIVAHEVKTTPRDLREANGVGEKAKVIGDKAWKLSTAWVLSGVMEAAILQGFAALAGSQQEKEDANSLSEYLAAAVAGPTYGIYWLGAGLSGLIKDKITGKHAFLTTGNPLLDKFTGAYRSAKKVITKPAQAEAEDYISTGKAAIDAVAMMFLFARQYGIAKALGGVSAMGNVAKTGTHAARNAGIMDQSTKPVKHNRGILD